MSTALQASHISKTFGGVRALRDVALDVQAGEIHGLLGQNGSGKSTLIKILSGYHSPDSGGELLVRGRPVDLPVRPGQAAHLGLSFVHQDLAIAEDLTVLENMAVGRYRARSLGLIHWRRERERARQLLEAYELDFNPEALVKRLNETDRALLAIVRAVDTVSTSGSGGLLVLDEPTVYLPQDSLERLFTMMRTVAERGTAILFVTHQLGEVLRITDRATVLRDGTVVGTLETQHTSEHDLISMILGREPDEMYPETSATSSRPEVLRVENLAGAVLQPVTFSAFEGETLGITGLVGSGYEEVPYLLFGAATGKGTITLAGRTRDAADASPRSSIAAGLALVPANRLRDGVASHLTVEDNVGLPLLRRHFSKGRLRLGAIRRSVRDALHLFDVRPADPDRKLVTLSGGNQQKAVLAKWLQTRPRVLLLHEPTQGVDVGARGQIFTLIRGVADQGTAVIIASSEHEDLGHLCDRVLVFRAGRLVSELTGEAVDPDRILHESYLTAATP